MIKNEKSQGVWNVKEQAPQTHAPTDHPPEGETQTTEGKTPKKLPERPSIAPPCRHEIEGITRQQEKICTDKVGCRLTVANTRSDRGRAKNNFPFF